MIFHKSRDYYRTKASIDKAVNQKTAYKVQVYNNSKIDELVTKYNSGETVNLQPPATMLQAELSILNKPEVFKNYQRIINSKYTSNDNLFKMLTKDKASQELSRVVEAEVERIAKNVQYAEQVLKTYDIPLKMYNDFKAQQQNKSLANRQEILKQVAIKNNELLVSEGLNIPSSYSYRNLETTAENLLRQSQMLSKHEEINSINQNYIDEGKEPIYNQKEWIWTGEGVTTRHASNDHQKRQVNEPFIIVNDETLDIDELMYPSDPAGSPSNTYICYCEVEYLTENGGATPVDLAEPVVPEQNILSSPVNNLGALSVLKPPKEFINTNEIKDMFFEEEGVNGQYWLNETKGAYVNENGKWEYKGLEADETGALGNFGKWNAESIARHNYESSGVEPNAENNIKVKFSNTVESVETKANKLSDEVVVENEPVQNEPVAKEFDQERFNELRTHDEVADFFGYEFIPEGTDYVANDRGKNIAFYDSKHDVYIRFFTEEGAKLEAIDFTNSGKSVMNIKEVIKGYHDAPTPLKTATDTISYVHNPHSATLGGECLYGNIMIYDAGFHGHGKHTLRSGREVYGDANLTLWHEMTHAFDFSMMGENIAEIEARADKVHKYESSEKLKREWEQATKEDKKYQKENGLMEQDTSLYGEESIIEDIAEMGSVISAKLNNKEHIRMDNGYTVKVPDETRASGFHRKIQTVEDTMKANPNRAKLMEKWLTNPNINTGKIKTEWRKHIIEMSQKWG